MERVVASKAIPKPEMSFKCSICDKKFVNNTERIRHIITHEEEHIKNEKTRGIKVRKYHQCFVCYKKFKEEKFLKKHNKYFH